VELIECGDIHKTGQIIKNTESFFLVKAIDCCVKLFIDYYNELIQAIELVNLEDINKYSALVSDINEVDANGWNPMIRACYKGSLESVISLEKNGGSIHSTNLNGTTTLMYAKDAYEKKGDIRLIKFLLENGVSHRIKDIWGKTIVDYTKDSALIQLFAEYD
jgi:methionyl-tRNA formyltransferase